MILGGCLIAAITYVPDLPGMIADANVAYDAAGKIASANPNILAMIALVWIQIIYVTMVYGPIAAFLVEYFPAAPLHVALDPVPPGQRLVRRLAAVHRGAIVAATGNPLAGLAYPIIVALITVYVGGAVRPRAKDVKIWDEVGGEQLPPEAIRQAAPAGGGLAG